MAASVWSALGDRSLYLYVLAIAATALAVVIPTVYILHRIFKHRESTSAPDDETTVEVRACPNDAVGNDDDANELENGESEVDQEAEGQILSPRYPDPVEYCEHIQGEFKRVQQSVATRTIEKSLTEQQLLEEREVQRKQLGEIFRLMQEQQERFGIGSMDDMQEQMKLYAL